MKLLYVMKEDEANKLLKKRCILEGFEVQAVDEMNDDIYDTILTDTYDLILLDSRLSFLNGSDLIQTIRKAGIFTPILFLSVSTDPREMKSALDAGADCVLPQNVAADVVISQIHALLRINNEVNSNVIEFGDLIYDGSKYRISCTRTGRYIDVTGKEQKLIEYLMMNKEQILSKRQISEHIWNVNAVEYNNVEVYIFFLRKKLKEIGTNVRIRTIRGMGYRLEIEPQKEESTPHTDPQLNSVSEASSDDP